MTASPASDSSAGDSKDAAGTSRLKLVGIGLLAAALLFFVGWMLGRSPVAGLEGDLAAAEARATVRSAEASIYRAAVALEERNFGTANDRLRRAAALLNTLPADEVPAGMDEQAAATLRAVQARVAAGDLNVAVDVETQRSEVLGLAGRLAGVAEAPNAPGPSPAAPAQ